MVQPFRLFAGGPLGSGRQFVSWIHREDWVGIAALAIADERFDGAVNVGSPNPVRNAEFARAIGKALGRPSWFRTPAAVLRAALGEMADGLLLSSQRMHARAGAAASATGSATRAGPGACRDPWVTSAYTRPAWSRLARTPRRLRPSRPCSCWSSPAPPGACQQAAFTPTDRAAVAGGPLERLAGRAPRLRSAGPHRSPDRRFGAEADRRLGTGPVHPRADRRVGRGAAAACTSGSGAGRSTCCCGRRCTATSRPRPRRCSRWPSTSGATASDPAVARLLEALTIHLVPMLNPDGARRFQRRNAQGIDINRDALLLQTPEGPRAEGAARPPAAGPRLQPAQPELADVGRQDRQAGVDSRCSPWRSTRRAPMTPGPAADQEDVRGDARRARAVRARAGRALRRRVRGARVRRQHHEVGHAGRPDRDRRRSPGRTRTRTWSRLNFVAI